ncbi:hypothetical protein EJ110_NYTH37047 [Nymphaea thermarum]|nr:hypothetical protein EJ110_NYTH37047 [Nymphaea thermarum]
MKIQSTRSNSKNKDPAQRVKGFKLKLNLDLSTRSRDLAHQNRYAGTNSPQISKNSQDFRWDRSCSHLNHKKTGYASLGTSQAMQFQNPSRSTKKDANGNGTPVHNETFKTGLSYS